MTERYFELFFYLYMPSIILVLGAIVVLFANAFAQHFSRSTSIALCIIFIITATLFCFSVGHITNVASITFVAELLTLCASGFFMLLVFSKYRFVEFQTPEFYPLYLFSVAGFLLMINADNFMLVFLGLEIGSLPLCVLIAFNRRIYGIEASIKYFVASALASIFLLLGILFFYLYYQSFGLSLALSYYKDFAWQDSIFRTLLILFGVIFIFAGIGFKISLVPWHTWMPDVYEGSNPILAGYISVVPKIAGFVVFYSIFGGLFSGNVMSNGYIENLLRILLYITLTIPNIAALVQKDVKRMLAFSSISHSGFALACIYLGDFNTLALYWILFFVTNLGIFALLWINIPKDFDSRYDYAFERFYGYGKKQPIIALGFALFMLSLAGIPPFSIFWGKIFILSLALQKGEIILACVMIFNSAIAVCYYLKLIVAMYFRQPYIHAKEYVDNSTRPIRTIAFLCVLLSICSIFVVSYFLDIFHLLPTPF